MGWVLLAGLAFATAAGAAQKPKNAKPAARGVSDSALAEAAKRAMLSEIDYGHELCDGDRDIETWLNDVVGETAAKVEWRGGACELTNELNPLDAGSTWCGGATIIPKGHAKEPAAIEAFTRDLGYTDVAADLGPTIDQKHPEDDSRRIDYVLVPETATVTSRITPIGGEPWHQLSDHLPVLVEFEV